MSDWDVDALDRDLDALGEDGRVDSAAAGDGVLELLASVRAADWSDRAAGERVAVAVAARLRADRGRDSVAATAAVAYPNGHEGLKVAAPFRAERRSAIPGDDSPGRRTPSARRPLRQRRRAGRRVAVVVSAAAVVLGAAVAAVAVRGGAGNRPWQVYRSRFAAEVLPGHSRSAGKNRKLGGGWQLLSYLSTPGWQADDIGTTPDGLSCPAVSTCYMTAARPVPQSGPGYLTRPRYNLLQVSQDGGRSWTTLSLPSDISITTPLQCPVSVTTCYAAGYDGTRVVLLTTTNGGRSWWARPIPGPASYADALACTTPGRCVGLFVENGWAPGYYLKANNAEVLVTRDGGLTWAAGPPTPHGQLPDYLACARSTCVLFDQLITTDNNASVNGSGSLTIAPGSWAAWHSRDGGATWQRGTHPASIWPLASNDLPARGTISCSDAFHCWAAMSSQIGEPAIATAFAATSDGGATWVTQPLPARQARHFIPQGMSCPTALRCYAAGGDTAGPVILTTRNSGTTWSPVSLPKTSTGNAHERAIAQFIDLIACAAARRCVAAPAYSPYARWIPVYSLGSG